jgi:hypothetical protein
MITLNSKRILRGAVYEINIKNLIAFIQTIRGNTEKSLIITKKIKQE